jgi:hypothetical protein
MLFVPLTRTPCRSAPSDLQASVWRCQRKRLKLAVSKPIGVVKAWEQPGFKAVGPRLGPRRGIGMTSFVHSVDQRTKLAGTNRLEMFSFSLRQHLVTGAERGLWNQRIQSPRTYVRAEYHACAGHVRVRRENGKPSRHDGAVDQSGEILLQARAGVLDRLGRNQRTLS